MVGFGVNYIGRFPDRNKAIFRRRAIVRGNTVPCRSCEASVNVHNFCGICEIGEILKVACCLKVKYQIMKIPGPI